MVVRLFESGIRIVFVVGTARPIKLPDGYDHKEDESGNDQQRKEKNIAILHIIVAFLSSDKPGVTSSWAAIGR